MLFYLSLMIAIAQEDGSDRVDELYDNGRVLFEEGQYDAAILAWKHGYKISQFPDFLKNIAIAYEAQGNYEEAIQYLLEYRALASPEDQEQLKLWVDELKQKQAEAEKVAKEKKSEAHRLEEAKRLEQEKMEEEKRLAKEAELEKEMELLRKKEELLKKEQELANQKGFQMPPKLPMWTSITGTVLSSGAAFYFHSQAQHSKRQIELSCGWNTGFCLESPNKHLALDIDMYQEARRRGLIASGLTLALGSASIWQVSKNITVSPNTIIWSTTW